MDSNKLIFSLLIAAVCVGLNDGKILTKAYKPKPPPLAAQTQAPPPVTQAPGTVTQAPGTVTQAPPTVTQAPGTVTQAPGTVTQAPPAPGARKNPGCPDSILNYTINSKREKHGVAPLLLDQSMKSIAEKCADYHQESKTITDPKAKSTDVKTPCPFIENLGQREILGIAGGDCDGQTKMLNDWYTEEIAKVTYDPPADIAVADDIFHAVQLIWANTAKVWCSISNVAVDAAAAPPTFMHTCIFENYGDVRDVGAYKRNVLRPK